jgi:hypothetical protein
MAEVLTLRCCGRREELDAFEWAEDYGGAVGQLQPAGAGGRLTSVGMHPKGGLI